MALQRTTLPATEPVTLAEAKLHLRVDHAEEDALISVLIAAARTDAENRLQRTLITSGWTLTAPSFYDLCQTLPMAPLQSVASVAYVDPAGATQTLPGAEYRVDVPASLLQPTTQWPATAVQSNAVTVAYTAGFGNTAADVPAPIRQWMLLAIGDMYANRERSSDKPAVPQGFADGLLDSYKVWAL